MKNVKGCFAYGSNPRILLTRADGNWAIYADLELQTSFEPWQTDLAVDYFDRLVRGVHGVRIGVAK